MRACAWASTGRSRSCRGIPEGTHVVKGLRGHVERRDPLQEAIVPERRLVMDAVDAAARRLRASEHRDGAVSGGLERVRFGLLPQERLNRPVRRALPKLRVVGSNPIARSQS